MAKIKLAMLLGLLLGNPLYSTLVCFAANATLHVIHEPIKLAHFS